MCVQGCVSECVHVYACVRACVCMHVHVSICLCVRVSTCVCMCVSLCLHVCVHARVCMRAYTHVLLLSGRVKLWADTFGRGLYDTVTKYSGSLLLQKVSATQGSQAVSQVVSQELCPGGEAGCPCL